MDYKDEGLFWLCLLGILAVTVTITTLGVLHINSQVNKDFIKAGYIQQQRAGESGFIWTK